MVLIELPSSFLKNIPKEVYFEGQFELLTRYETGQNMAIFISFLTIANIFVEMTTADCFVKEKETD